MTRLLFTCLVLVVSLCLLQYTVLSFNQAQVTVKPEIRSVHDQEIIYPAESPDGVKKEDRCHGEC